MTKFKKITIKNFLSYGKKPTVVELDNNLVSLIIGTNQDVGSEGYSRNGVGKSTVFHALYYVLFDDSIDTIKKNDFINLINKKNMEVVLEFEVNGSDFVLRRGRKPNVLELTRDGDPFTLHSTKTVDETIIKLIGMDSQVFLNSSLLTTNADPFMKMKPAIQRNFMENILSMDLLSERAEFLKMRSKEVSEDIKIEETKKEVVDSNIEKTKQKIETLIKRSEQWERELADKKSEVIEGINLIQEVDVEKEREIIENNERILKEISDIETELEKLATKEDLELNDAEQQKNKQIFNIEKELSRSSEESHSRYIERIRALDKEKDKERQEIDTLIEQRQNLKAKIDSLTNEKSRIIAEMKTHQNHIGSMEHGFCPFCEQDYTDHTKVEEINREIERLDSRMKEISEETKPLVAQENSLNEVINEKTNTFQENFLELEQQAAQEAEEEKQKAERTCASKTELVMLGFEQDKEFITTRYQSDRGKLEADIKNARLKIKPTDFTMLDLNEIDHDLRVLESEFKRLGDEKNPYIEQIRMMEADLEPYDDSLLKDLQNRSRHYKMLIKMLTDNKSFVRRYIIDQYVPFLNNTINGYLGDLESPHKLEINSDLTTDIHYMGRQISYGNISNGERLRINLSVSLAFRELLEISGRGTNLLMIDELLDSGADPNFFLRTIRVLEKQKEKASVFVISHRDEFVPKADRVLNVTKKNGFSRMEESKGA